MSDYYRNQQQPNDPYRPDMQDGAAPWDMAGAEPNFAASGVPMWPQSEGTASFLAEESTALGAEMQQSGMPLYSGTPEYLARGDEAPTRIARPLTQQKVSRRTSVEREPYVLAQEKQPDRNASVNAEQSDTPQEQPVRRRRSRVAERAATEETVPQPSAQAEFDPFEAGDSETASALAQRRSAVPGGRYTGARTAMPAGGAAQRRPAGGTQPAGAEETWEPQNAPVRRPAQPQGQGGERPVRRPVQGRQTAPQTSRPAGQGQRAVQQRPAAQGQRPANPAQRAARPEGEEAAVRHQAPAVKERIQQAPRAASARPADDPFRRPAASIERPRYEFEEPEEERPEEEEASRRGSVLVPIIIALLVLGGLLAGLCLPDWEGMGGIGSSIAPVKGAVISAFNNVKNMIVPEEDPIKSFSAAAADTTAPTQVMFTVQTSKSVTGLRIVNDLGYEVYNAAYSEEMEAEGEVISNSNALIWTPSCTVEEAYAGGYTVYATKKDGSESVGVGLTTPVNIAAPKADVPAIQGFSCDTSISAVPAHLTFTFTTSQEVTAVRVADSYNTPVASMYISDADANVTENGDLLVWTLEADIEDAYSGSYIAQYQTAGGELNFTPSTFEAQVQLGSEPSAADETIPEPTQAPTPEATSTPEPTATPVPTPSPSPTPSPTPTPVPTSEPLPNLSAEADDSALPSALSLSSTVYSGSKTTTAYTRERAISMLGAFTTKIGGNDYAGWPQAGVLTFRSGPLRQNAAYDTVEVESAKLSLVWSQPVGSMKINEGSVYGVTAPGQPVIVKWPTQLREKMGIYDEMKEVTALKEVIVAAQDGKVYFYNLLTGEATRDPIDIGAPSRGGLSVATNGTPILGVGQYNSKLANKTVKNGYHIIDLLTNTEAYLLPGDGSDKNSNYTGFTGAALFDSTTGTMIVGGQNGVLYTMEIGTVKDAYNYLSDKLSISTSTQGYKSQIKDQAKKNTNIDASVAVYNNYVYYGDQYGVLQCVDLNTLSPIWAVDLADNLDATPALDVSEDGTGVALYIGNTILNKTKGVCTICRIDALSGKTVWTYEVPELKYAKGQSIGCYASPVIGQNAISDLVIFTVTKGKEGAEVIALNKESGSVVWQTALESEGISSPVAVYNEAGDAWILQAESNGNIHLMDAQTGKILDTLLLEPIENPEGALSITASPAVYGDLMLIGTTGKDAGGVYCIKIQ